MGFTIFNMLVVWVFTGIWHGAGGNFVIWGLFLFLLITIEKLGLKKVLDKFKALGHIYMMIIIPISWLIFAIGDLDKIAIYLARLFPFFGSGENVWLGDFAKYFSKYAIVFIIGLFLLLGINLTDFTGNIFKRLLDGPKGIREEILEQTQRKKKSFLRREVEEIQSILKATDRENTFPFLCTVSLVLFAVGAAGAAMLGNFFLVPVAAVGFMFLPFWYIKLTASHFKKDVSAELETALSIITTAYLRSEDILTSVEENLEYLNPPVKNIFQDFVSRIRLINPDLEAALDELRARIADDVFKEWVDALKACLYDRSLKTTLTPIVAKLSDMRIVNAELEYMVMEPRKEFITMVVLVVGNIPLLYFLNKDWYHTLMHTVVGQIMLSIAGIIIFVSTAHVIRLTKPIEYRS